MQIELREYQKQDFKTVETIIRETWHYDEFSSQKTAVKLARAFLSNGDVLILDEPCLLYTSPSPRDTR